MLLKNRIALVTGSTHNIGLGIARAFAREGAKVIVHSRHEEDARKSRAKSGEIILSLTLRSRNKWPPCSII
jgi:NAD(P)-dependent dehydrogenase (short-subunit alcohol dehydrogenase family)